jgi:hypothetical protein
LDFNSDYLSSFKTELNNLLKENKDIFHLTDTDENLGYFYQYSSFKPGDKITAQDL